MQGGGKQKEIKINIGSYSLKPQEERLAVANKKGRLVIGIPLETRMLENRIALVPNSVRVLTGMGHRILIESTAGDRSNYSDLEYIDAGAEIVQSKEEVFEAGIIIKVEPPSIDEISYFKKDQILISPLQIPIISKEYIEKLKEKQITAVAMEYLQAKDGSHPIVRIMSEIAGINAIITAAFLLEKSNNGRGVLLGGITGVPPAKVVILGAGVVAEFAIRAAMGLGASVRVLDNNIHKLMRIQGKLGSQLHTSTINPKYLEYQLRSADIVIGAIHSKVGRTPIIVSEDLVMKMKKGSVIIDVSIDQGGCIETSEVTTLDHPTFIKHDVIHYCVPNIASKVPRTASNAVSNIITPILLDMGTEQNFDEVLFNNKGYRNGVYTYKGCLTNKYLSQRFDIRYTDLGLLLTSSM